MDASVRWHDKNWHHCINYYPLPPSFANVVRMFIFRIVSSLIGLVFTLLFLPFKLIGIPLHVVLLPFRIVLKLLARNVFLVVILIAILLLLRACGSSHTDMPQLTPAPRPATNAQGVPIVQPVTKREDGDSAFATDLYAQMTEAERTVYSQNFYWAMTNLADMQTHSWNGGNIAGTLRANDSFTNPVGDRCRHFSEALKVHTIQQTISGTACEQGGGAWCKLKPNATPACGLGGDAHGGLGNILDDMTSSLRHLF